MQDHECLFNLEARLAFSGVVREVSVAMVVHVVEGHGQVVADSPRGEVLQVVGRCTLLHFVLNQSPGIIFKYLFAPLPIKTFDGFRIHSPKLPWVLSLVE